jgi:hypothetical protein
MGKHVVFLFIKVNHEKYPIQCHFKINLCHLVHDYPILNARNKMAWLVFHLTSNLDFDTFLTCVSYSTYESNLQHDSLAFYYWVVKLVCSFLFKGVIFQNPIEDFFPHRTYIITFHSHCNNSISMAYWTLLENKNSCKDTTKQEPQKKVPNIMCIKMDEKMISFLYSCQKYKWIII